MHDKRYRAMLKDVLEHGFDSPDRTGTGTKSMPGYAITYDISSNKLPALYGKRVPVKSVLAELVWMLKGMTDLQFLEQNGCKFWREWPYKKYLANNDDEKPLSIEEFAYRCVLDKAFSLKYDIGPGYGKQWRNSSQAGLWLNSEIEFKSVDAEMPKPITADAVRFALSNQIRLQLTDAAHKKLQSLYEFIVTDADTAHYYENFESFVVDAMKMRNWWFAERNPEEYTIATFDNTNIVDSNSAAWVQLDQLLNEDVFFNSKAILTPPKDPIVDLIEGIKKNPYSRRHILNTWSHEELDQMELPPCHMLFQVLVKEDMLFGILYMRSNDLFLGHPANAVQYSMLLHIIAKLTGYKAQLLQFNIGDAHIYNNHKRACEEYFKRNISHATYPTFNVSDELIDIRDIEINHLNIADYNPLMRIKADISV